MLTTVDRPKGVGAFRGVHIVAATPLDKKGRLCEEDFVSLLRFIQAPRVNGESIAGVTVCGEMGEGVSLTREDRIQMIRLARQTLLKEISLVAAVFALSLRQAGEEIEEDAAAGVDGLLVAYVPPFACSERILEQFYQRVAAATHLPVIAYLNKTFKGSLPPVALIQAVYRIPGIIGIKDSTGDPRFMETIIQQRPAGKLAIQTESVLASAAMEAGVDGFMMGFANLIPECTLEVWSLGTRTDPESRRKTKIAQDRLNQSAFFYQVVRKPENGSREWVVIKEALAQMGIIREEAKFPASPFEPLPFLDRQKITQLLFHLVGRERVVRPVRDP